MPTYMIVHQEDPKFVSRHINQGCKICAARKKAIWKRVYYNLKEGRLFCEWEAPDQTTLKDLLNECGLPCKDIVEVEEMTAGECCWDIFGELKE
ncbi:MAG: nickel-binding protein [Desulfatiglans sp.]|nr:DUF4242 domain-containing protein [Thermodesulfobacteriota bacterium]MEE4354757.1 nickel-binding protein [Desulfatiglans sp.]